MASDDDPELEENPPGVLDTLLMPLRLPGRVVSDIEKLAGAVMKLQSTAETHLASVDESSGKLVEDLGDLHGSVDGIAGTVTKLDEDRMPAFLEGLGKLQTSLDRIEGRVETLESLESTIEEMMAGLREDLNARMQAVEHEVRAMQPPMTQMARDVAKLDDLLPNPTDGPLARLKDTLSPG